MTDTVLDRCSRCGAQTTLVVVTFRGDASCYVCGADVRDTTPDDKESEAQP